MHKILNWISTEQIFCSWIWETNVEALRGVQESLTGNEWTLSLILEWFQKVEEGIFLPKRSYLRFADSKS